MKVANAARNNGRVRAAWPDESSSIYSPASTASATTWPAVFLMITRFKLLYGDWRGYLASLFALVWVANLYMSIYNRLRLDIKHERIEIKAKEGEVEDRKPD